MLRQLHRCLIVVCLAGFLLLLPLCCAGESDYNYDPTPSPEYDYNATFDYIFFSNGSSEELDKLFRLKESGDEDNEKTDLYPTDLEPTESSTLINDQDIKQGSSDELEKHHREKESEDEDNEKTDLNQTDLEPTESPTLINDQASSTVVPSFLLTLFLSTLQLLFKVL